MLCVKEDGICEAEKEVCETEENRKRISSPFTRSMTRPVSVMRSFKKGRS